MGKKHEKPIIQKKKKNNTQDNECSRNNVERVLNANKLRNIKSAAEASDHRKSLESLN